MVKSGDFDVMRYLWEKQPREDDQDYIIYTLDDIDVLWELGFVDAENVSLDEWRASFATYQQSDSTYKIREHDFLALDKYRYKGEIYAPFDAELINEGQYTEEGFQELVDLSIKPEIGLSAQEFAEKIDSLKQRYKEANGLISIRTAAKAEIAHWLEEYPSPLRRMEIIFMGMVESFAYEWTADENPVARSPQQIAQVEASAFTMLSSSDSEAKSNALKALQKVKDNSPTPDDSGGSGGMKLGSLKRSRRGIKS